MNSLLKKCALAAIACSPALLFAQGGTYLIKGKLDKLSAPATVYLSYGFMGEYKRDSAVVKDGVFELKGNIAEPVYANLLLKQQGASNDPYAFRDVQSFYLEKGTITVKGKDSLSRAIILGGADNKAYQQMRNMVQVVADKKKVLNAAYKEATAEQKKDAAFQQAMEAKSSALDKEEKQALAEFVKGHPNSVVCFNAINTYAGYARDVHDVEPLFNMLSASVQQTEQGKEWAATIAKLKTIALGAVAPAFTQQDTTGQAVTLNDFRGKYVLIDFWASWCKPCRAENPVVIKAYNRFKSKNFTVLGVSIDTERNKAAWLKAIREDQLPWMQVSDLKMKNEAAELYDVHAIPQNFLLDPQGKIVAKNLRGEELEKKLEEILGKG